MLYMMSYKQSALSLKYMYMVVHFMWGEKTLFNNNNNIYLLQLGCNLVAVVILHVYKTWNWLQLNLSREGYMRIM